MTETNVDALPWEEPPKPSRGGAGGVWIDRLKPLMELPGRSKVVFVGPAGRRKAAEKVAYSLRHGKLRIPDGDWEFTSRWIEAENVSKVYARYLGAGGDTLGDENTTVEPAKFPSVEPGLTVTYPPGV